MYCMLFTFLGKNFEFRKCWENIFFIFIFSRIWAHFDDESVRREIVISLKIEKEEEQTETKRESDKSSSGTSEKCDQTDLQNVADLPTTAADNSENNNRKETPNFKKKSVSKSRNYRKPSHEDD